MEAWLWAGLTAIVAFGLTTLAAVALANVVGLRLHDRERPAPLEDYVYLYLSDEAQELRQRFRKLPRWFLKMYLIFTFLTISSVGYVILCSGETLFSFSAEKPSSSLAVQEPVIVIFILTMVVTYKICMVYRTVDMSSRLYRVLQDTQNPG